MWALASLWHLLGNTVVGSGWSQALVALAAGWVLWRPGAVAPLSALAVGGLALAWSEAPVLGNHWLLAAFVDLAILLSVTVGAARRRVADREDLARRLLPVARLCLLGFYAFAAFSKLNTAFLDRSTSCAVFYFHESTSSLGLSALQLGGATWLEQVVIVGTVAVELAIPVLLVVRRTRHVGVVVGLVFHFLLALDRTHQFFDFSSVLAALFVLFLPASAGQWIAERLGSLRARLALVNDHLPDRAHVAGAAIPALVGLLVAADRLSAPRAQDVGWWTWQPWALLTIVATLRYLDQHPPPPDRGALRPHHAVFVLVPLLVLANGLTPYLEVKTGYGWNMYANLQTVDGESNHLLVRRTLPLTDEQADLVEIIRTNDIGLLRYVEGDYALTFTQLRAYLADHPDVQITYQRGDQTTSVLRAGDRPELVEPVPTWREKLLLFRPVDLRSPERCVPTFGPAR
jgi:hypothetical protein